MAKERRKFDVGIIVPLREEFRYVVEVAPQLESIPYEGTYFYRLDFGPISAVCCVVDQMGPLPALHATTRLLGFADVRLRVVLGVGGALDEDIAIGDVVVGAEINEFQANSKAESVGSGYEVRYSGRHWPLDFRIREALSHFEFSGRDSFVSWQAATTGYHGEIDVPDKGIVCSQASLHLGPIASGNIVAASSAFVAEVKKINRKFAAIDMEAAGVAAAAAERIHPLPCLVVRGISDRSNEGKKTTDGQGKKAWRRYSVRNATSLLLRLLNWHGFLNAVGLADSKELSDRDDMAIDLVNQLKACIGGPWIVGVLFGAYYHGPSISAGEIGPMDINRLRLLDVTVRGLLNAAEKVKQELLVDGDLPKAASHLANLMDDFRARLDSEDVNSLLKDFDNVVREILCPQSEDERVESVLLQADKLDEEVGNASVIEFLGEFVSYDVRIRERYVDSLATAKKWPELIQVIKDVEPTHLSRVELEHGFSAYAEMGLPERAKKLIRQHQDVYDDNPAKVFRREVSRRYPETAQEDSGGEK